MLNIRLRHILSIRPGNIQAFFPRTHGNGLLACSGMLNGFFGEGEMRHIAHWRSVKYVDEFNEEGGLMERPSFASGNGSATN